METLEQRHQQSTTMTTTYDRLAKKTKISVPDEIINDILSRLPVKSILRFRSVSKQWLSHISHPSFTKLHSTRSTRTALFISAYDHSTCQQHLLSAARHGGPLTHLFTIHDADPNRIPEAQHLNGLVFFTTMTLYSHYLHAYVVNPSTRKLFKLPHPYPDRNYMDICYYFGFDESTNQHKVLTIRKLCRPARFEVMIFSLSTHSWRKIDPLLPVFCFTSDPLNFHYVLSVCVNSVIHVIMRGGDLSSHILAFDLRTEKFSVINTPQGALPNGDGLPCIIKTNGCVGILNRDYDRVVENNEMHAWILQDYENRVWVKEIIMYTDPWTEDCFPYPEDFVNAGDVIIFSPSKLSENVMSVPVYNRRSRCFKSLQFTFGRQFRMPRELEFNMIRSYVESMVPL